jgi:polar amino acid transport system substrate-binding protein
MVLHKLLPATLFMLLLSGFASGSQAASDTIRVITDPTLPPMEFMQSGQRTGFDIELVEALAKEMGKKVEWTDSDYQGLIPAIVSGRADAAASAIYISDARKKIVDFTDPYLVGGQVVLTKKDGSIKTLKDLDGRKVSVQMGTDSTKVLQSKFPHVKFIEAEKGEVMLDLVNTGRSDAAITGRQAAGLYAHNHPNFTVLPEQITTREYGIAISKKQPELTKDMNAALARIRNNGDYQKIADKWLKGQAQ